MNSLITGCATTSPSEVECALREKFYTGYQKSQDAKANNINYEDNPKIRKASEQVHYCRSPKTQVEKEKINELKFKAKINKPIEKIAGIIAAAGFVASIPFAIWLFW